MVGCVSNKNKGLRVVFQLCRNVLSFECVCMRVDQARVSNLDVVSFINMYVCVAIASLPVLLHVML